jgi:hypothetical protein
MPAGPVRELRDGLEYVRVNAGASFRHFQTLQTKRPPHNLRGQCRTDANVEVVEKPPLVAFEVP